MFSSDQDIFSLFEIINEAMFFKRSKCSGLWQGGFTEGEKKYVRVYKIPTFILFAFNWRVPFFLASLLFQTFILKS